MIGFVAEYLPKTGALGMSLVGGMGIFTNWNLESVMVLRLMTILR